MKTVLFYPLAIIIILSAGFIYLQIGGDSVNPFRRIDITAPRVSTEQGSANRLEFKNYGPAPEFGKITNWFNSDPLVMADLQGRVVLVNFWTYSCISCVRALPYFDQWAQTYKDQGLVIVGVHTPEYAFEKVTENLQNAIDRYKLTYPIAQDNSYALWNAYNNQFWPSTYLIDKEGKIVYTRFGDSGYDLLENAVKNLLSLPAGIALDDQSETELAVKPSQKILFGTKYANFLSSNEKPSDQEQVYTFPSQLRRNSFALEGVWKLSPEKAALTQGYGRIRVSFNAARVRLSAQSIKPVTLKVTIDGKQKIEIPLQALGNYELFAGDKAGQHTLEIEIPQPGFEAGAFIFD